ncbi:hypothetical protein N7532_001351 [Penicillium argentinense]|uniref:Uncharacterized protein n=1 Tax=Penicillium argentinense TaxID=1131581 RepID=A0A9W9G2A8_9EURO|nr:uncharacterized protein N7532_001351 [Penicillium argentinense]KAJ5110816.1 hypothetical protein N7532_001351 [Penicillium argentinense]
MNLKLPQILLALGFSSLAMADISSKCDASTAEFDTKDYPSQMAVQCGSQLYWHLDLNKCFLNQDGTLYYYKDGNAFISYAITDDNKQDILDLADNRD